MNQLKSIYNSPFKNSYSHPIHTCFPISASNGFLRFTYGPTPTDLLVASMAANPFDPHTWTKMGARIPHAPWILFAERLRYYKMVWVTMLHSQTVRDYSSVPSQISQVLKIHVVPKHVACSSFHFGFGII